MGYAKDYIKYMRKCLQLKKPEDFILGTGKLYSVKDFLKIVLNRVNLDYKNYFIIDKKNLKKKIK